MHGGDEKDNGDRDDTDRNISMRTKGEGVWVGLPKGDAARAGDQGLTSLANTPVPGGEVYVQNAFGSEKKECRVDEPGGKNPGEGPTTALRKLVRDPRNDQRCDTKAGTVGGGTGKGGRRKNRRR